MKTSVALLTTAATLASALVQMEVRYSDKMIDVGNMDVFAATWQAIFAETGNQRAILTDRTFTGDTNPCTHATDTKPDITVQVKMNGAWGQTKGLQPNQMRDGLVNAMWEVLRNIMERNKYEVFTGCRGTTWTDAVSYRPDAPCGRTAARTCEEPCKDVNSPLLAQCDTLTLGHKVPSSLRVTAFVDGALQPDDLIIEFAATNNPSNNGCGIVGDIAAAVAGFIIPVVGDLFAKGIEVGCSS